MTHPKKNLAMFEHGEAVEIGVEPGRSTPPPITQTDKDFNPFQRAVLPVANLAVFGRPRLCTAARGDGAATSSNPNQTQKETHNMTTKSEAFPSRFIKAADLKGGDIVVDIDSVKKEEVGDGDKFVLYFAGKQKGLVLNATNWDAIEHLTGCSDTADWTGSKITLRAEPVSFRGQSTMGVRVKPPPKAVKSGEVLDDAIPF